MIIADKFGRPMTKANTSTEATIAEAEERLGSIAPELQADIDNAKRLCIAEDKGFDAMLQQLRMETIVYCGGADRTATGTMRTGMLTYLTVMAICLKHGIGPDKEIPAGLTQKEARQWGEVGPYVQLMCKAEAMRREGYLDSYQVEKDLLRWKDRFNEAHLIISATGREKAHEMLKEFREKVLLN
jgi:hypothetical protein